MQSMLLLEMPVGVRQKNVGRTGPRLTNEPSDANEDNTNGEEASMGALPDGGRTKAHVGAGSACTVTYG